MTVLMSARHKTQQKDKKNIIWGQVSSSLSVSCGLLQYFGPSMYFSSVWSDDCQHTFLDMKIRQIQRDRNYEPMLKSRSQSRKSGCSPCENVFAFNNPMIGGANLQQICNSMWKCLFDILLHHLTQSQTSTSALLFKKKNILKDKNV